MADLPLPPPVKPFRTKPLPGGIWYRVHRFDRLSGHYAPTAFNDTPHGNARFSPLIDPVTGGVIPTLYAAQTPRGAIAEVVLHDVPTPSTGHLHDWEQDKASLLHLSKIALPDLVNTCPVVMLFGDRVLANALRDVGHTQPIAHFESEVFQLLDDLGCGLAIG